MLLPAPGPLGSPARGAGAHGRATQEGRAKLRARTLNVLAQTHASNHCAAPSNPGTLTNYSHPKHPPAQQRCCCSPGLAGTAQPLAQGGCDRLPRARPGAQPQRAVRTLFSPTCCCRVKSSGVSNHETSSWFLRGAGQGQEVLGRKLMTGNNSAFSSASPSNTLEAERG